MQASEFVQNAARVVIFKSQIFMKENWEIKAKMSEHLIKVNTCFRN